MLTGWTGKELLSDPPKYCKIYLGKLWQSTAMGDAAEYMMELQSEVAQRQACELAQQDEPRRPLLCWADEELVDIFDRDPGTKTLGIFLAFHRQHKIGNKCFLGKGVSREAELSSVFNSHHACD